MSDERDSADAASDGNEDTNGGQTVVVTRPRVPLASGPGAPEPRRWPSRRKSNRPPRNWRRGQAGQEAKAKKKKAKSGPSRNPILFVWNYLKQVVAELRKVIWPNRKQMVSYTTVVLLFLASWSP